MNKKLVETSFKESETYSKNLENTKGIFWIEILGDK